MNNKNKAHSGNQVLTGSEACVEGAFAAGCRFYSGYPIQPAIEIMQSFLAKAPKVDATFVQMEDEISALAALLGGIWTGKKGLTATSGPGFSLMMEHLGLGVMLETPCVIVNVQRAGLSTGLPTRAGQGDVMQARWGSHGDYEVIVLSPSTPQEMFDLTIKAFNLSERFRVPVVLLTDEYVVHMEGDVNIPPPEKIKLEPRRYFKGPTDKYLPFKRDKDLIPKMVDIGQGYRFHVTGLTHDDRGYPVMNEECQEYNVHPLLWKIRNYTDEIIDLEEYKIEDADVVFISFGAPGYFAKKAVDRAREKGINAGSLKLNSIWPFPEKQITKLAEQVKAFIVPEMNFGQIVLEVERCSYGMANVAFINHGENGIDNIDNWISTVDQVLNEKNVKESIIEYSY
jgi:2-oxoglutarate/2-oxoacid ferredoxin oxidoreductase subunit alpha